MCHNCDILITIILIMSITYFSLEAFRFVGYVRNYFNNFNSYSNKGGDNNEY